MRGRTAILGNSNRAYFSCITSLIQRWKLLNVPGKLIDSKSRSQIERIVNGGRKNANKF